MRRLPLGVDTTKLAVLAVPLAMASKVKKTMNAATGGGATLSSPTKVAQAIVPKMTAGGLPGSATNPFGASYGGGKSTGPTNQQTNRSAKDAIKAQNQLNENLSGGPKVAARWGPFRKARDVAGDYVEGAGHAALDAVEDAKRTSVDDSHLRHSLSPQRQYV